MDAIWDESISNNTSDSKLVNQRVFVGNLKPHITREILFDIFKKFGQISAISINRNGYGFVQFSSEDSALNAQEANGLVEKGCALQVKSCSKNDNRKRMRPDKSPPPNSNDYSRSPTMMSNRSPSPSRMKYHRYQSPDFRGSSGRVVDSPSVDDRQHRPKNFHEESRKPNDCEIVVMSKQWRSYAETVERRLKNLGLKVDVLFMKDEALLLQALDDLTLRGTLYACVIAQQHEAHNSITLNVLHGTPQEHRNMPVDEALKFLAKNFREHLEKQRDREVGEDEREIKFLLKLVIESRYLSIKEYDRLIGFLQMKRQNLIRDEFGDDSRHGNLPSNNSSFASGKLNSTQSRGLDAPLSSVDLQDQIRKLIGTPAQGLAPVAAPVMGNVMMSNPGPIPHNDSGVTKPFFNLNSPHIQEALDQLLKKGITRESSMLNDPRPDSSSRDMRQSHPMQSAANNYGGYDQRWNDSGFNGNNDHIQQNQLHHQNASQYHRQQMRGQGYDGRY